MNLGELPMITFTVITQMCVGMFIVLGILQLAGRSKFSQAAMERLTNPAVLAIGPAMVIGLIVSMFHMHDVTHVFNVFRHFGTSWLSREIVFGLGFAALGFLFCLMQLFEWGSATARQIVAGLAALVGIGLIVCQAQIYYSLVTVPAWNSWATWVQFFATALILGSLAVGATFTLIVRNRDRRFAKLTETEIAELKPLSQQGSSVARTRAFLSDRYVVEGLERDEIDRLLVWATRWTTVFAIVAAAVLLIAMPLYVSQLALQGGIAAEAAAHYASWVSVLRFAALVIGALGCGLAAFFVAAQSPVNMGRLTALMVTGFLLALIGEFAGRTLFYDVMLRVGI